MTLMGLNFNKASACIKSGDNWIEMTSNECETGNWLKDVSSEEREEGNENERYEILPIS